MANRDKNGRFLPGHRCGGRPTDYQPALAERILWLVTDGATLKAATDAVGRPPVQILAKLIL